MRFTKGSHVYLVQRCCAVSVGGEWAHPRPRLPHCIPHLMPCWVPGVLKGMPHSNMKVAGVCIELLPSAEPMLPLRLGAGPDTSMTSSCPPDDFSRYLLASSCLSFLTLSPREMHNYAGDTREHLIAEVASASSFPPQLQCKVARRPSTSHNKYIII